MNSSRWVLSLIMLLRAISHVTVEIEDLASEGRLNGQGQALCIQSELRLVGTFTYHASSRYISHYCRLLKIWHPKGGLTDKPSASIRHHLPVHHHRIRELLNCKYPTTLELQQWLHCLHRPWEPSVKLEGCSDLQVGRELPADSAHLARASPSVH